MQITGIWQKKNTSKLTFLSFKHVRLLEIMFPAVEKTLSYDAEFAGIAKHFFLAIFATSENLF